MKNFILKAIPAEFAITVKEYEAIKKQKKWYESLLLKMKNRSAGYDCFEREIEQAENIIHEIEILTEQ